MYFCVTSFQTVPKDTTTKAMIVVSRAATVQMAGPAIETPDAVLPVNLDGFLLFVSNVNLFLLFLFISVFTAIASWLKKFNRLCYTFSMCRPMI